MNSPVDLDALVDRYVSAWNEADAGRRQTAVADLWAPDGVMINRLRRYDGREAVTEGVTRSYEAFVARGFRFEDDGYLAHHGALLFSWLMRTARGEVDSRGTNFIQLAGDGRIALDHQFVDATPAR